MVSKKNMVSEIFSSVSDKYDIMNDVMSCGMHHIWKKKFVDEVLSFQNLLAVDVACGTGDILIKLKKKYEDNVLIVGCDPIINMLNICKPYAIN